MVFNLKIDSHNENCIKTVNMSFEKRKQKHTVRFVSSELNVIKKISSFLQMKLLIPNLETYICSSLVKSAHASEVSFSILTKLAVITMGCLYLVISNCSIRLAGTGTGASVDSVA